MFDGYRVMSIDVPFNTNAPPRTSTNVSFEGLVDSALVLEPSEKDPHFKAAQIQARKKARMEREKRTYVPCVTISYHLNIFPLP